MRKRKRTTPEEWAHLQARLARLEARERELRLLVEAGVAGGKLRASGLRATPVRAGHVNEAGGGGEGTMTV